MFRAQWVCRSCMRSLARPHNSSTNNATRQFIRRANTAAAGNDTDTATASNTSLPPVLLKRARNMAAEHSRLNDLLATDFDTKVAKRAGELSRVATALREWDEAQASIKELTTLEASEEDAELRSLAREELESTRFGLGSLSDSLSAALTPRDPFADLPCLLEIRPGPGGAESRYFGDAVFRMYRQYCARLGLRAKVVKYELADGADTAAGGQGSESPLLEALIEIQDAGAYDRFRGEAGMHRVQRVPATEGKGRTHTSAVAVWVLPAFPEAGNTAVDVDDPESLFYIDPKEVKSEKMRASGAGGQHVNKTESAIRLTHEPTGISVSMQDSRSQHANREAAWTLLRSRLASRRKEEREEKARSLRNSVLARDRITRGDKIRTYNYSQDRCTDHRGGLDVHNLPDVLAGGQTLDKIIESSQKWLIQKDIEALIVEEEAAAAELAASTSAKGSKK